MTQPTQHHNQDNEFLIQAVVLDDTFGSSFVPYEHNQPACLNKVCNIPILNYVIELLVSSKVYQIIIMSAKNIDKIKTHVNLLEQNNNNVEFVFIQCSNASSICDLLRELDSLSIIRNDFLLTKTSLISNININNLIKTHNEKKKIDKNLLLSMTMMESKASKFVNNINISKFVYIYNEQNHQLLSIVEKKDLIKFNCSIFEKNNTIMESSLNYCFLDICSVELLALISENFDYEDYRKDFVYNVLQSEIISSTIYLNIIESKSYSTMVDNTDKLISVSMDIMNRLCFPFTPDSHVLNTKKMEVKKNFVYIEKNKLHYSSKIKQSIIAKNTIVNENVTIENSIIEQNCIIHKNTLISNCIISNNSKIGNSCILNSSVLGSNCQIDNECELNNNKLSQNTYLRSLTVLPKNSIVVSHDLLNHYNDYDIEKVEDHQNNKAYFITKKGNNNNNNNIDNNDNLTELELTNSSRNSSDIEQENFMEEVSSTLIRAKKENHSIETISLELNTLRMSFNALHTEILEILIPFVIGNSKKDNKFKNSIIKNEIEKWKSLILRFVLSQNDQMFVINQCEKYVTTNECISTFSFIIQTLYENDVVEEDTIIEWFTSNKSLDNKNALIKNLTPFVTWLEEAEEESSEN